MERRRAGASCGTGLRLWRGFSRITLALHPGYKRGSQREDIKYSRIADLLQLRRIDELRPRRRAQARRDGEILLAVDLERHRRRAEAGADVDLPQLVQRSVVVGSDGTVQESQEDEPASG